MPLDQHEYGKRNPAWVWWSPGESEAGLSGFDTRECRDAFAAGGAGPFKRRIATGDMRECPQMPFTSGEPK